jgi:hypothetical protein
MRTHFALLLSLVLLALASAPATAGDVNVRGYTRSDGTYVAPHVRSEPNNTRADNYGSPSGSDRAYGVPAQQRDYDSDGVANRFDPDDDNDGTLDDSE